MKAISRWLEVRVRLTGTHPGKRFPSKFQNYATGEKLRTPIDRGNNGSTNDGIEVRSLRTLSSCYVTCAVEETERKEVV